MLANNSHSLSLDEKSAGARAIIKVLGQQYRWLAVGYDLEINVNVNVSVYSVKSPLSSADFTIYAPGTGTLSYTVSSPLGRIQHLRTLLQL